MADSTVPLTKTSAQNGVIYERVLETIKRVESKGFGEVKVIIQNGYIHRILSTEDALIIK